MTAPTYQFHFDPDRPSPFPVEFLSRDDETVVIFGVPSNLSTAEMPLEKFLEMLERYYPWTLEVVETCPTCGR